MLHSGSTKHRSPHWRKWWGAFSSLYRRGDGATCNTMAHGASVTILAKAVARLRFTILTGRCAKHHDLGNRDSNANTGHHTGESAWAPPAHYTDEVTGWGERRHHRSGVSKAPVHYVTETGIIKGIFLLGQRYRNRVTIPVGQQSIWHHTFRNPED